MNPIDALFEKFSTPRTRRIGAVSFAALAAVLIGAGFLPGTPDIVITIVGSIAGVAMAVSGILLASVLPFTSRHRYPVPTRRVASLGVFGAWIVVSALITQNEVIADHIGGAVMVTVVLGLLAFSSKTAEEIQLAAEQAALAAEEDIFDDFDDEGNIEEAEDDLPGEEILQPVDYLDEGESTEESR